LLSIELGPTLTQAADLGLAFVLCALIGLEREASNKSAGLRTHTLVGFGAALFTLVGAWGFSSSIAPGGTVDPTRIAAQVVSGIGFIGGGVIFVRRDAVKGLTTAATVWLTAAVGMACGAGLRGLALLATIGHFLIVFGLAALARRLPRPRWATSQLALVYLDGYGVLRHVLLACSERGFTVSDVATHRPDDEPRHVGVILQLRGTGSINDLVGTLAELEGMVSVATGDVDAATE
jgi:putative Mg2+ transporter-C (MgtC) family protein